MFDEKALQDWKQKLAEVSGQIAERASEVDRAGRFPSENIDLLKQIGYLTIPVPEELGGPGAPLDAVCELQSVLARACGSTALAVNMHLFGIGASAEAYRNGVEEAVVVLELAKSGAIIGGSFTDATGLNIATSTTKAKRVEGGFRINGKKSFCSLAPVLDVFFGTAMLEPEGRLLIFALPKETDGMRFIDNWDTVAMRATGSWDVVFDDAFVPEIMAEVGPPWQEWDERTERIMAWFVATLASVYLGIAKAASEFTFEYVSSRKMGGMEYPLSRQPGMIFSAAEVVTAIRRSEALLFWALQRRSQNGALDPQELVLLKYSLTNDCHAAVDRCMRMAGGSGIFRRLPLERYWRDSRAGPLHPPSNDIAEEVIGKAALGIDFRDTPRWGG